MQMPRNAEEETNIEFDYSAPISEYDGKPVWGNYDRITRTITIFLGTFGTGFKLALQNGIPSDFLIGGLINEFTKTVQEEYLHACVEDITGKVERKREEWVIDRIEEMTKIE